MLQLAEEAPDSDEERLFESYRLKRLGELSREVKRGRFGFVKPIGRGEWAREVTEGSLEEEAAEDGAGAEERKQDEKETWRKQEGVGALSEDEESEGGSEDEGRRKPKMAKGKGKVGTGVVCCLYKDG